MKRKGAFIRYVGGGPEGLTNTSKKRFKSQGTIELNIQWPTNFIENYSWPLVFK